MEIAVVYRSLAIPAGENGLDSECVAVALDEFTQTWLPGLAKNGVELVMFPTKSDEQNLVMSANDLAAELAS